MKKIILAILISLPLVCFAEDDIINKPQWSDFAPSSFVDVKEQKGMMAKINVTANYWYQRRVEFEKELENCQNMEKQGEIATCYENLKTKQYQENSDYNARIEAKLNANNGVTEMQSRTDTMLPINGYLQNMLNFQQNELR